MHKISPSWQTSTEHRGGCLPVAEDVLVYCASGGRSALSDKTLKDFGHAAVYNIGGFKELADAGLETEPA
jgi:rhodanese-related sulfurtransferase